MTNNARNLRYEEILYISSYFPCYYQKVRHRFFESLYKDNSEKNSIKLHKNLSKHVVTMQQGFE